MAVRNDFSSGEVLTAADLNDTFASKLPYSYGTATPSTSVDGFLWYDENDTPPTPKFWDGAAFQALTSGKILQVVRATDSTDRVTNSTSFIDASISVTITPQKSDSTLLIIWSTMAGLGSGSDSFLQITDNSNNALSGAEESRNIGPGVFNRTLIGHSTPATTSAVTYKGRFRTNGGGNMTVENGDMTGQMYAIEVSA